MSKKFKQLQKGVATHIETFLEEARFLNSELKEEDIESLAYHIVDQTTKAFGGCDKCYGKGYFTEARVVTTSADFFGDKDYIREEYAMNFCDCERGFALRDLLDKRDEREIDKTKTMVKIENWFIERMSLFYKNMHPTIRNLATMDDVSDESAESFARGMWKIAKTYLKL